MAKVTIRPWKPDTDKEWEIDIRYTHPSAVDSKGQAVRLRKRCQHVGTKASADKWAHAFVSAEISRLASGAVVGNAANDGEREATAPRAQARGKVPTLAEFHPQHLEFMHSNGLKQRTIISHSDTFRLYLGPILGSVRLDKIGATEVEAIKTAMAKPRAAQERFHRRTGDKIVGRNTEGKPLQASTINQVLRKLSAILGVAKYLGIISEVPAIRYKKEEKKDPECYTFLEVCALVDAAHSHLEEVAPKKACERTKLMALQDLAIALLLLDTGIRVGELLAIHPDQIDLESKVLHVKLTESAGMLTIPKGNRKRDVPLTTRLVPVLRALLAETPGPRLLMRNHKWEQRIEPWNQQAVWESLNRTLTRAGMPPEAGKGRRGRGPHKCRHTCATQMLEAGVDLPTVQKILGHARITQTEKYIHLLGESMQRGSALYEARMARGRHTGDEIRIHRSPRLRAV
jgi:integrase